MDKVRLEGVKATMAAVVEDSNSSGLPPPAFIVYAQELDDPATGELISRGAAVFRDRIAGRIPANTGELLEATALVMNGESARRQRNNFWQSRPRQLLQATVTQVVKRTRTWDPNQEVVGSADEYRSIVDLSKPLRDRLNRERGWPIDI
jgi:hypothetical protein